MPSSFTASLRLEKQFTGENVNLWGEKLCAVEDRTDTSIAGWFTKALTVNYSLTTANGIADEARNAMLKFTGAGGFTVTIPAVSKRYDVMNSCAADVTVSNGSASVAIKAGEVVSIVTDGGANIARVQPTDYAGARITSVGTPTSNTDAATKKYVDDTAFTANAGILPGQPGNAGALLTTDGTTASWAASLTSFPLTAPVVTGMVLNGSAKQNVTAVAATSIDLSSAEFFTKSISSNTAFSLTGATSGKAQAFALQLTISSSAIPTFSISGGSVKWTGGAAPSLPNGTHVLGFLSFDGVNFTGVLAASSVA